MHLTLSKISFYLTKIGLNQHEQVKSSFIQIKRSVSGRFPQQRKLGIQVSYFCSVIQASLYRNPVGWVDHFQDEQVSFVASWYSAMEKPPFCKFLYP